MTHTFLTLGSFAVMALLAPFIYFDIGLARASSQEPPIYVGEKTPRHSAMRFFVFSTALLVATFTLLAPYNLGYLALLPVVLTVYLAFSVSGKLSKVRTQPVEVSEDSIPFTVEHPSQKDTFMSSVERMIPAVKKKPISSASAVNFSAVYATLKQQVAELQAQWLSYDKKLDLRMNYPAMRDFTLDSTRNALSALNKAKVLVSSIDESVDPYATSLPTAVSDLSEAMGIAVRNAESLALSNWSKAERRLAQAIIQSMNIVDSPGATDAERDNALRAVESNLKRLQELRAEDNALRKAEFEELQLKLEKGIGNAKELESQLASITIRDELVFDMDALITPLSLVADKSRAISK